MNDRFSVKGKVALVTGSSGGLGFTLARGLAVAGAKVILNGRDPDKLQQAHTRLSDEGFGIYSSAFDVTDSDEVGVALTKIFRDRGSVDILVNNAGINIRGNLEDFEEEKWRMMIDSNLTGPYIVTKAVVKRMIKQSSGKIINICSMQSELGRPSIAPYAASKGGLKMLTRAMAVEWAKHNIQVNGIGPGYFKTEMTRPLYEDTEFDRWLCSRTPANRWGDPDELIGALLFLSSAAGNYVNGHILYVDGGLLAVV